MRLNAHPPTVKAWISHKANAPHHVAKVCDVYNNTVSVGSVQNCANGAAFAVTTIAVNLRYFVSTPG